MIKKTITYDDYNEPPNTLTEDFYFNLDKREIMEMQISREGGLQEYISKLSTTEAGPDAYFLFKDILLASVGRKGADGKSFDKDPELTSQFEHSNAMVELIFGFLGEGGTDAAEFVKGLLPARMVAEVEAEAAKRGIKVVPDIVDTPQELRTVNEKSDNPPVAPPTLPPAVKAQKWNEYTHEQLLSMPESEFQAIVGSDIKRMTKDQLLVAMERKSKQ